MADEISTSDLEAVKQGSPKWLRWPARTICTMTVVVSGQEYPVNLVGVTEGFQEIRNLDDCSRALLRYRTT